MDYSQATADLIERQCRNVEREDFALDKTKAEELILRTYDLFNLSRPKNIVWCVDIFEADFANAARSAWSASSALSASSAWSASSASSARSARSASSASSARSAWSALDYDFDWYIFEFEYYQNPDKGFPPNENDRIYLEYCELLMQAKEAGLGYRVESENTLYLVPTPLVKIDEGNRFHSDVKPAIRWKGGKELYYLAGINFEKELWERVVSGKMSFSEILEIENTEQRLQAMRFNPSALLSEKPELVHKSGRDNELYCIKGSKVNEFYDAPEVWLLRFRDPSKHAPNDWMVEEADPEVGKSLKNADKVQAYHCGLTYREYKNLKIET